MSMSSVIIHDYAHLLLHPVWLDISPGSAWPFSAKATGPRRSLGECITQKRIYSQRCRKWLVLPIQPFHDTEAAIIHPVLMSMLAKIHCWSYHATVPHHWPSVLLPLPMLLQQLCHHHMMVLVTDAIDVSQVLLLPAFGFFFIFADEASYAMRTTSTSPTSPQ